MAVPGPVTSSLSETPHLLVREGQATLITRASEAVEELSATGEYLSPLPIGGSRVTDDLGPARLAVFEAVPRLRLRMPGEIAVVAGLSVPQCLAELAALQDAGLVQSGPSGWRLAQ